MDDRDQTCYIFGDTIILPFDLNGDHVLNVQNVPDNIPTKLVDKCPASKQDKDDMSHAELNQSFSLCEVTDPIENESNIDARIQFTRDDLSTVIEYPGQNTQTLNQFDSLITTAESDNWQPEIEQTTWKEAGLPARSSDNEGNCDQNNDQFSDTEVDTSSDKLQEDSNLIEIDRLSIGDSERTVGDQRYLPRIADEFQSAEYSCRTSANNTGRCLGNIDVTSRTEANPTFESISDIGNSEQKVDNIPWNSIAGRDITPNLPFSEEHIGVIKTNVPVGADTQHFEPQSPRQTHSNFVFQGASSTDRHIHTNAIQNKSTMILDSQQETLLQTQIPNNFVLQGNDITNNNCTNSWTGGNVMIGGETFNNSVPYEGNFFPIQSSGLASGVHPYMASSSQFEMPEIPIPLVGPYQFFSSNEAPRPDNGRVFIPPFNRTIPNGYVDRMNVHNLGELQPVCPIPAFHPSMFPHADRRYPLLPQSGLGTEFLQPGINVFPQTQFYPPYIEQPYFMMDGLNMPYSATPNFVIKSAIPLHNQNAKNSIPQDPTQKEEGDSSYIFPQLNGRNLFREAPTPQQQGYFQGEEVISVVSDNRSSTVPTSPKESGKEACPQEDSEETRIQRVLSMERALRSKLPVSAVVPSRTWTPKRRSSSMLKEEDQAKELDPKVRAEMQREEVANAAKAIFMKRTGTLFHWIHPGESKSELKSRVEEAWNKLSEKETNYYFSQVIGRCNSDFPTRPMVNPRLMELLNPKDVQELTGLLNNDKGSKETGKVSDSSTTDVSFRQRQRSPSHSRSMRVTRGQSSSKHSDEGSRTLRKSSGRERLSTDGRDREVHSSNDDSCINSIRSPSSSLSLSDTAKRRRGNSNELSQLLGNKNVSSDGQKLKSKGRGPRGPYKKTVRRLLNLAGSDEDWESTIFQDKSKLKENHCKTRKGVDGEGSSIGALVEEDLPNGVPKRKVVRGPRGPYKKRKQEVYNTRGKGKGRGRGRPPKRRLVSSEEDTSVDSSLTLEDCESGRDSQLDDSLDPCVSRQYQSFSGKVRPSQGLQEELKSSVMASDGWSSQEVSPRRMSYERKAKSKSPIKEKKTEAFLVDSEAMQMQFYQEVSSEDENKRDVELPSLPVTSAEVAVDSLRRQQGSASSSTHATSVSDNSDADWSPRQPRQSTGRSTRRGTRVRRRLGRRF